MNPDDVSPASKDEGQRLAALHRYAILDTPQEQAFNRLCALAREVFGTAVAVVALVDADREWSKARIGLEVREWPRAWAFYPHLNGEFPRAGETYVIPDATQDERFRHNPFVTGDPWLRFLAGSPLYSPGGHFLGMMAVGDPTPRTGGVPEQQKQYLVTLAALAVDELELRLQRRLAEEAATRAAAEASAARAARSAEARLRMAHEAAGAVAFDIDPQGRIAGATGRLRRLLGLSTGAPLTCETVAQALSPADRGVFETEANRIWWQGGSFLLDVEVRGQRGTLHPPRRVELRGAAEPPPQTGGKHGRILGVAFDVTARRQAAERERLLQREVNHRARNALAVVEATLRMTRASDVAEYARLAQGRVATLLRVQELLAEHGWGSTDLHAIVQAEAAHLAPRITREGPVVAIVHTAASPISMTIHELLMNALKHGALSLEDGRVSVTWWVEDRTLHLVWQERGGPRVSAPTRRGFGTRLIETSVRKQLGGTVEWQWRAVGLACELVIPLARAAEMEAS